MSTARRLLATVLAPWLVVFLTLPESLHSCAMHSVGAVASEASATSHAGPHGVSHAGMHRMASMAPMAGMDHGTAMADMPDHAAPATGSSDGSSHDTTHCTCPEGCCTVAVAVALAPPSLSWVRALLVPQAAGYPPEVASVALSTDVRLPFANGPPAQG